MWYTLKDFHRLHLSFGKHFFATWKTLVWWSLMSPNWYFSFPISFLLDQLGKRPIHNLFLDSLFGTITQEFTILIIVPSKLISWLSSKELKWSTINESLVHFLNSPQILLPWGIIPHKHKQDELGGGIILLNCGCDSSLPTSWNHLFFVFTSHLNHLNS